MPQAKRPTDYVKMTVWTPRIRAELSGSRFAGAIELFRTLDVDKMPEALEMMQRIYADRKLVELIKDADCKLGKCAHTTTGCVGECKGLGRHVVPHRSGGGLPPPSEPRPLPIYYAPSNGQDGGES